MSESKFKNNKEDLNEKFVENRLVHTWEEVESLGSDEVHNLYYNYTYGKIAIGSVVKMKGKYKPMMHMHNNLKHNFGFIRDSKGEVYDLNFDDAGAAKLFVEGQLIEINSRTV
jgi:hypothetical protein